MYGEAMVYSWMITALIFGVGWILFHPREFWNWLVNLFNEKKPAIYRFRFAIGGSLIFLIATATGMILFPGATQMILLGILILVVAIITVFLAMAYGIFWLKTAGTFEMVILLIIIVLVLS